MIRKKETYAFSFDASDDRRRKHTSVVTSGGAKESERGSSGVLDIVAQTHENTDTFLYSVRQSDALLRKYSNQLRDHLTFDAEGT